MATIMITGGAGFIGYHLACRLKAAGHIPHCFDNFNDYYDPALKRTRADLLRADGIAVTECDLTAPAAVGALLKSASPDLIMHLAAYAGVRHSMQHPDQYIHTNIVGTHNLIQACEAAGVKKVVYASTSCVMAGNPLPWRESDKLGYPLNPYGYSKAANESQFMVAAIPCAIGLRFFTVYGPWGRPDMALFHFARRIAAGEPITLFNNGDMIRDFTYIDDIVNGIVIVIEKALAQHAYKDIFNIGNGRQVLLTDFVDNIERQLNKKAIVRFAPKHPADTQATWSDTTKLQALGYRPAVPIEEGVKRFTDWFKSHYRLS